MNLKFQVSNFGFPLSSGFTLLEVMIAVAIIAIALTAVLGTQSRGISLAGEARFKRTASLLAQAKIADLRDLNPDSGAFGDDFPGYTYRWTVAGVSFGGFETFLSDHLRRIEVEVSSGSDKTQRYRLTLYRYFP